MAKHTSGFKHFAEKCTYLKEIPATDTNDFLSLEKAFTEAYDDVNEVDKKVFASQFNSIFKMLFDRVQEISDKAIYSVNGVTTDINGEATITVGGDTTALAAQIETNRLNIITNTNNIAVNDTLIAQKQNQLIAGSSITLTDNGDNTTTIDAAGGTADLTELQAKTEYMTTFSNSTGNSTIFSSDNTIVKTLMSVADGLGFDLIKGSPYKNVILGSTVGKVYAYSNAELYQVGPMPTTTSGIGQVITVQFSELVKEYTLPSGSWLIYDCYAKTTTNISGAIGVIFAAYKDTVSSANLFTSGIVAGGTKLVVSSLEYLSFTAIRIG